MATLQRSSGGRRRRSTALAHERDAAFIDAEVTRLFTNYELPPDIDVARLVHTEQQRMLLDESGLARSRPDAVRIQFARPRGYAECLETIKAHGYDLAETTAARSRRRRTSLPTGTTPSTCRRW